MLFNKINMLFNKKNINHIKKNNILLSTFFFGYVSITYTINFAIYEYLKKNKSYNNCNDIKAINYTC